MFESFSKVVKIDGKDYPFELTSATHQRVKMLTGISLPDCVSDVSGLKTKEERAAALDGFTKLMDDFDKLPHLVRAMILPDLEKNGIDEKRFHEIFDGALALAGANAITQAVIDFFRSRRDPRGDLLGNAVRVAMQAAEMDRKMATRTLEATTKKLEQMDKDLDEKGQGIVEEMIRSASTTLSTTLPESLACILDPSRSAP